jgi:predicted Zn finger-like uncharacterized protein
MKITCPSCSSRYSVENWRIPPGGITIRCPDCQFLFVGKSPDGESKGADQSGDFDNEAARLPTMAFSSTAARTPGPSAGDHPLPLPGSVPPKPRPPARDSSAIALPGKAAPTGAQYTPVDDLELMGNSPAPVPLPGQASHHSVNAQNLFEEAVHPKRRPSSSSNFDLGLEFSPSGLTPAPALSGLPELQTHTGAQYFIRTRATGKQGPFSLSTLKQMIGNGQVTGVEDLSDDGVKWRSITSHPELNDVINRHLDQHDALDLSSKDLRPVPMGASASATAATFASPSAAPSFDEVINDDELEMLATSVGALNAGAGAPAAPNPVRRLGGGAIPKVGTKATQLQILFQTYRLAILGIGGGFVLLFIGVLTHILTDAGPFGVFALVDAFHKEEALPPPAPPPPVQPKVVDQTKIARLIHEAGFEDLRSVLATVEAAGTDNSENLIFEAKAQSIGVLLYGPPAFSKEALAKMVAKLNSSDLSKAFSGDREETRIEVAKSQAALDLAERKPKAVVTAIEGLLGAHSNDAELLFLLGLAKKADEDPEGAFEAFDQSLMADATYAPTMHAIADLLLAQKKNEKANREAASWYEKAVRANPMHTRSALAASRLLAEQGRFGKRRRILFIAAPHATEGLPPENRASFLYEAGKALQETGTKPADALRYAAEATRLDPSKPEYANLAAEALMDANRVDEAMEILTPGIQRNPKDISFILSRARALTLKEDIAKAFIDLDNAQKIQPADPRPWLWETRFNLQLGKMEDAKKSLAVALKLSEKAPEPHIEAGNLAIQEGDVEQAFDHARKAVEIAPNNPIAQSLLGDCYRLRKQFDRAQKAFEVALNSDDENPVVRLGYANFLRDQSTVLTGAEKDKSLSDSLVLYTQALLVQPKDPRVLFAFGTALELSGAIEPAVRLYQEAASYDKRDVGPHLKVVAAYLGRTPPKLKAAKESLEQAQRIDLSGNIKNPEVPFWEGKLSLAESNPQDAVSALKKAVEQEPRNATYQFWLGKALEANGELYEAIHCYEQAIQLNKRMAEAYRAVGWAALERHRFDDARKAFKRYLKVAPHDLSIWTDLGQSYSRQNRTEEAKTAYEKAVKYDPKNAKALLELGNIYSLEGQEKKAVTFFRRAAREDPANTEAACQLGIVLSRDKTKSEARSLLERCSADAAAPEDLAQTARDILGGL